MKTLTIYFIVVFLIFLQLSCTDKLRDPDKNDIIIENSEFRLIIGRDARAVSLLHKPTGQECLQKESVFLYLL